MLFRRLVLLSLFVGVIAGGILTLSQQFQSTAIILQSEVYEVEEDTATAESGHEEWAPKDGTERLMYSVLANVLTAIGYSAMMLSLMAYFRLGRQISLDLLQGAFWGVAGFVTFFVAPGLGLAPEIPGTQAAALESRQLWWILTVIATGTGIGLIFIRPQGFRSLRTLAGLLLLVIPHLVGAPHVEGPEFLHPDSGVVETLMQLHRQFIISVSLVNFIFWISMGLLSAWGLGRWVFRSGDTSTRADPLSV